MSTLREAAQQELEALEDHAKQYPHMQKGYTVDAITALRTALAEPKQEPVAWILRFDDGHTETTTRPVADWKRLMWESAGKRWTTEPLYTHPPQRKPLSDEEIRDIAKQYALGLAFPYDGPTTPELFARAIERKHGIGGEA